MKNAELQNHGFPGRWWGRAALMLTCTVMAACAHLADDAQKRQPRVTQTRPAAKAPATATRGISKDGKVGGLQHFTGNCKQVEEDGFAEDARLQVVGGQVRVLDWRVKVGRRGQCSFNLHDFRQVKQHPHIELTSLRGNGCKLLIYQEPRRVTLAHSGCDAQCTKGVAEEAWPVMFNPRTGQCARLDR